MKLKYSDETDKCYGLTGVAIGLTIWDATDILSAISLDTEAEEAVALTPAFYFTGNPGLSAKVSWNHIFQHFQVTMGMTLGNVMCRSYVLKNAGLDPDTRQELMRCLEEEGRDTCSLEPDEVARLFDKSFSYLHRVFNHSGVRSMVHDFARDLADMRTMTRGEVVERLRALQML